MHFKNAIITKYKDSRTVQIKGAKETQQLNARHELGFCFAMKDITETDGKIGMRSADQIIVLYQC